MEFRGFAIFMFVHLPYAEYMVCIQHGFKNISLVEGFNRAFPTDNWGEGTTSHREFRPSGHFVFSAEGQGY